MQIILNVAEKPSVAKNIAHLLSNNCRTLHSLSKYNPVYGFDFKHLNQDVQMYFTSVTGHMMELAFDLKYKNWHHIDPLVLLKNAEVRKQINPDKQLLADNLQKYSRMSNQLILWLDCDREGENIAFEVIDICTQVNPNLHIMRAQFSNIKRSDIIQALNNLRPPNKSMSNAVETRMEIDLRIGAAYTRFQTLTLQSKFLSVNKVVSYGPCQFPTLGFVVDRYIDRQNFIQEEFFTITCGIDWIDENGQKQMTKFHWNRGKIFNDDAAAVFYVKILEDYQGNERECVAEIIMINKREEKRYRPSPMSTLQLQKWGTSKLSMTSSKVMEIAEKLYQKGFISYPRTETEKFAQNIDLQSIINEMRQNNNWGQYADKLLDQNKFMWPKAGKNDDQAHPPIHPLKDANPGDMDAEEFKVYELVTRYFLACCSQDAILDATDVDIVVNDEFFHTKGKVLREKNFMEILGRFCYQVKDTVLPNGLEIGQRVNLSELMYEDGKTQPPELLEEQHLLELMEKHGIGTDATWQDHIKTIQERNYAYKNGKYMVPTKLGIALVTTYERLGMDILPRPDLRALMERRIQDISENKATQAEVLSEIMLKMENIFIQLTSKKVQFITTIGELLSEEVKNEIEEEAKTEMIGQCGKCGSGMEVRIGTVKITRCYNCDENYTLPNQGQIKVHAEGKLCPHCQYSVLEVNNNDNSYHICPSCYNNPPEQYNNDNSNLLPCYKCTNVECSLSGGFSKIKLFDCPQCQKPINLRKSGDKVFCGCSGYPLCKWSAFLPSYILKAVPKQQECQKCKKNKNFSLLTKLTIDMNQAVHSSIEQKMQMEGENSSFCLVPGCDTDLHDAGYRGKDINPTQNFSQINNRPVNNQQRQNNPNNNAQNTYVCFKCNQPGHSIKDCPNPQVKNNQQGQREYQPRQNNHNTENNTSNTYVCFKCNQPGHSIKDCPNPPVKSNQQGQRENKPRQNNHNTENNTSNTYVCFKCNQPGHSIKDCPNPQVKNNQQGQHQQEQQRNQSTNNQKCFKCQQTGHFANNCTSDTNNRSNTFERENRGQNNVQNTVNVCFICQEPGHFAPQCPQKGNKGGNQKKGEIVCFICNTQGHVSSNCPNKGQPKQGQNQGNGQQNVIKCFKCNQIGHVANKCPDSCQNPTDNQGKQKKQAKACEYCGKTRHNKNDNCQGKKGKQQKQDDEYEYD